MSINKLALIRYKTLDECLGNRRRKWTLEDLIEKVSEVLYECEGITSGVSKRTIQADLQLMRSDKLGYNAPIVVRERKFYTYSTEGYTITNAPINPADVEKMKEVVAVLKQFNGFTYFDEMSAMVARLENNLYTTTRQTRNCIQFEDNKLLQGLGHITPLYKAILEKVALEIEYQSFKAAGPTKGIYFPYLLKEYRNRWFLLAKPKKGKMLLTLALDRMLNVKENNYEKFVEYKGVDFDRYFSDVIGVSKSETSRAQRVILFVDNRSAPYVITKPMHASQQILKQDKDGIFIRLDVVPNFELEREILGFGEGMRVRAPRTLADRIQKRIAKMAEQYTRPLTPSKVTPAI